MTVLPWRVSGARLHLPRDLQIGYAVGRMGAVTIGDVYPLFYGSPHTARFGFGRLMRLGLLRSFPRPSPIVPAWFSLTPRGIEWVAEQSGSDESELRAVCGIKRVNLPALSMRNRFWASLVLACRALPSIRLASFRPEWELRPARPEHVRVVPDAIVTLANGDETNPLERAWMVEMDAGTERSAVWRAKAAQYAELRAGGRLYGATGWKVLAVVPSPRRARTVAMAVATGGAGAFSMVGVADHLERGQALGRVLWRCADFARSSDAVPTVSLADELTDPSEADQQGQSAVDRVLGQETGGISS